MRMGSIPKPFEGNQGDDFLTWVERFELWSDLLEMQDDDRIKTFPTLLGDPAFALYKSIVIPAKLPPKTMHYGYVKSQFIEAFQSEALVDAFRAQLAKRKRKEGENLAVFAGELRRLVERAYPKYNAEAKNDVVLTHFCDGLSFGKKIRSKEPKTVDEAIRKAVKYELLHMENVPVVLFRRSYRQRRKTNRAPSLTN